MRRGRRVKARCILFGHEWRSISTTTLGYGDTVHGLECKRCKAQEVVEIQRREWPDAQR